MFIRIYIKLGTASEFHDERLEFHLTAQNPAGVIDYSNINEHISAGLNSGAIVQITAAEYYGIVTTPGEPPLIVNPTELEMLNQFLDPCPIDETILFGYVNGKWYKILWSTLKECLGGSGGGVGGPTVLQFTFRIGNPDNDPDQVPDPDEPSPEFNIPELTGHTWSECLVTLNGVEIYFKDLYDIADQTDYNWFTKGDPGDSSANGKLALNLALSEKDIVSIKLFTFGSTNLMFRVGNPANDTDVLPSPTDTEFVNPGLANKDYNKVMVTKNGMEIYHKSFYDPADWDDYQWYELHTGGVNGKFTTNVPFDDKDIIAIRSF